MSSCWSQSNTVAKKVKTDHPSHFTAYRCHLFHGVTVRMYSIRTATVYEDIFGWIEKKKKKKKKHLGF